MPKTECVCICHTKYVSPCSACLGHPEVLDDGEPVPVAVSRVVTVGPWTRVLPPADPAFACRVCDYTSDEYGDTHTHAERHEAVGEPGAGEGS